MNPALKIVVGALMIVLGVYSSVTFWNELLTLVQAGVGPLLVLIGAFIVWLESDELKMRRQQKQEGRKGFEQFARDNEEEQTEPDVEGHACSECGKSFDTERGLNIHKAQKHK